MSLTFKIHLTSINMIFFGRFMNCKNHICRLLLKARHFIQWYFEIRLKFTSCLILPSFIKSFCAIFFETAYFYLLVRPSHEFLVYQYFFPTTKIEHNTCQMLVLDILLACTWKRTLGIGQTCQNNQKWNHYMYRYSYIHCKINAEKRC